MFFEALHNCNQQQDLNMGNLYQVGECCLTLYQQEENLLNFVYTSADQPFKSFLVHNIRFLHQIIINKQPLTLSMDAYDIKFDPKPRQATQKGRHHQLELTRQQVQLQSQYQMAIIENTHKPYSHQQGIIFSPLFYFRGEFQNFKMQGNGAFHFFSRRNNLIKKTIKGKWKQNLPQELAIYSPGSVQPVLTIAFINGRQEAKLTLPDRTTYLGSIRFSDARKVQEIMTGKGVINFPNKDIYIGPVSNGLMHTGPLGVGRFMSKSSCSSYSGNYINGLREGRGMLTFECHGESVTISCEWKQGVAVGPILIEQHGNHQTLQLPYKPLPVLKEKKSKLKTSPH